MELSPLSATMPQQIFCYLLGKHWTKRFFFLMKYFFFMLKLYLIVN